MIDGIELVFFFYIMCVVVGIGGFQNDEGLYFIEKNFFCRSYVQNVYFGVRLKMLAR